MVDKFVMWHSIKYCPKVHPFDVNHVAVVGKNAFNVEKHPQKTSQAYYPIKYDIVIKGDMNACNRNQGNVEVSRSVLKGERWKGGRV